MDSAKLLSKIERDKARKTIEKYHQKKLGELIEGVYQKIQQFKNGKISAFDADYAVQIYHEQSKELFNFINTYYPKNSMLPYILELIEQEEKDEWRWVPKERL